MTVAVSVCRLRDFNFPSDTKLHADLQRLAKDYPGGVDHILMEVLFPTGYPTDPPFVRVVYPRFSYHTGHVSVRVDVTGVCPVRV